MAGVVGRDQELESLAAFLAPAPGASCLVMQGEPGIGKTTLWRHAIGLARERGFAVLLSRPLELDLRIPFAGLHDLVGGKLSEVLDVLPGPQRRALTAALLIDEPTGPPPELSAIAFALLRGLEVLASEAPVLIGIDDAQWLDEPSATVLGFAVHRIGGVPVRLLVARRATDRGTGSSGFDKVVEPERYAEMTLSGLPPGSIQRVVRDELGIALARPLLMKIHSASGGNPFFALEVARALSRHPEWAEPGEPLPVPEPLAGFVRKRLDELPSVTQRALEVAALTARPTARLAQAAAGGEVDLAPAISAGVAELDGDIIRFAHPLFASGIAELIDGERRRELHRRLARLVTDPAERARHLALGSTGTDPAAAVGLDEAARLAQTRGAPAVAAELLGEALRLTPESWTGDRARRLRAKAEATYLAGGWEQALALAHEALALASTGRERALTLMLIAEVDGRIPELEEAVTAAGDDAVLRTRARIQLAQNWWARDVRESLRQSRLAVADASASGDEGLLGQALAMRSWFEGATVTGDPDETADLAARHEAEARHDFPGDFTATFTRATLAMWRDEHEAARAEFGSLRDLAVRRGSAYDEAHALLNLAQVEWRAGNWDLAADCVEDAASLWPRGDATARALTLWIGAVLAAHRGQLDAARADAEEGIAAAGDHLVFRARNLWVLGVAALGSGNAGAALDHLSEAAALFDTAGAAEPGMQVFTPDLLDACLVSNDLERADALAADLLRRGAELARPRATVLGLRAQGLVLAARGEHERALAILTSAAAAGDRWAVPLERGRTLLALGAVQRQARHRRDARATLAQAGQIFEWLGAPVFAARVSAELGRIAGRTADGNTLTPAEQRVAERVACGLTNREVARDLVIAVHSVESALTSVYRKLGVRSRSELAARFASGPPSRSDDLRRSDPGPGGGATVLAVSAADCSRRGFVRRWQHLASLDRPRPCAPSPLEALRRRRREP
ncbi:MAG TPA: AAA family ATPase [Streptosporangiaceae bacterium]|nr:AAA family ATPase [Streptosporangiaceae bacterium]